MRNPSLLLASLRVVLLGVALLAASAFAQEAKILKIVGNTSAVAVTGASGAVGPGMTLPVSARIVTGAGVEVYVEAVTGVVAVIKSNTDVTVASLGSAENRTLDLRQGSVATLVDPKRYKANSYGVKTPRGVAAARGTAYTITVNGQEYTIFTASSCITVTPVGGAPGSGITMCAGGVSISNVNGGAPTTAAEVAANPEANAKVIEAAAMAVAAVAAVAADPATFGSASAAAVLELGQTVTTVVQQVPQAIAQMAASAGAAAPSQASAVVAAAVAAAGSGNALQVAMTAAQAAAQGAASTTSNAAAAAALTREIALAAATATTTAIPGQASTVAVEISRVTATGAVLGAVQAGQSANAVGTAIASGAASGAAQGAAGVLPAQAASIAGWTSQGAAQGATNAGATTLDGVIISNFAASGASTGSGTTVPPPPPPSVQPASSTFPQTTPTTPIDPTINVSPSS